MDADGNFDNGPTGQQTHAFPWTVVPSTDTPGTCRVIVNGLMAPLEMRELASTLMLVADAIETPTTGREGEPL